MEDGENGMLGETALLPIGKIIRWLIREAALVGMAWRGLLITAGMLR